MGPAFVRLQKETRINIVIGEINKKTGTETFLINKLSQRVVHKFIVSRIYFFNLYMNIVVCLR